MTNVILIIAAVITVVSGIVILLLRTKVIVIKNKPILTTIYFLMVIGVAYIALSLFGGPLLEKINAYQENVLSESEEECKRDDAPFWCNL